MTDSENTAECEDGESSAFRRFFLLFIAGFFMIVVGVIILIVAALLYGGSASFGAVIFLWFIPIAVGVGPEATMMIFIAVILALLAVIIFLIARRKFERANA